MLVLVVAAVFFTTATGAPPKLKVAACASNVSPEGYLSAYYAKEFAAVYIAHEYFKYGPTSLEGGMVKPAAPADVDVEIVHIVSGCQATIAFQAAMPIFMVNEEDLPHVVVGCHCPSASRAVSSFTTTFQVPQILTQTEITSNPDFSDKSQFPYIFRVAPRDTHEAAAHAFVVHHFGFKYASVIYIDSPTSRKLRTMFMEHPMLQGVLINDYRLEGDITIAPEGTPRIRTEMAGVFEGLSWVFVCYFESEQARNTDGISAMYHLSQIGVADGHKLFLFTEDHMGNTDGMVTWYKLGWLGALTVQGVSVAMLYDLDELVESLIMASRGALMAKELAKQARLSSFASWVSSNITAARLASLGFTNSVTSPIPIEDTWFNPFSFPEETLFHFDAAFMVFQAAERLAAEGATSFTRDQIFEAIRTLGNSGSYDGLFGKIAWDANLDRADFTFGIHQAQTSAEDPTGTWAMPLVGTLEFGESTVTKLTMMPSSLYTTPVLGPNFHAPFCQDGQFKPACQSPSCWGQCDDCAAGKYGIDGVCMDCPPGEYSNTAGVSQCSLCPVGRHSAQTVGSTSCRDCPAGEFAGEAGQESCALCAAGRFSSAPKSSACEMCARGKYSSQIGSSTECASCSAGETTLLRGSDSVADCRCQVGFFNNSGQCVECPIRMDCPGGSAAPVVLEGYWASREDPYEAFLCRNTVHCPGGSPGELCRAGHEGFLCTDCAVDHFRRYVHGACQRCDGFGRASLILAVIGFIICPLPIHFCMVRIVKSRQQTNFMFLSALMGQLLTYSQLLSMVGSFKVNWLESTAVIFEVVNFFMFNLKLIAPQCATNSWSFDAEYPLILFTPFVFAGMYFVHYLFSILLSFVGIFRRHFDEDIIISGCGRMFLVFHITIVKNAAKYFECYEHPNGKDFSMIEYPSVLCWTTDHLKMLPAVILALLAYCVVVFAAICWLVYQAPQMFVKVHFVKRYGFLMLKFRPDRWYWSVPIFIKNTILAFIMATIPDSPVLQAVCFNIVLIVTFCLNAAYQPWMSPNNNLVELVLTVVIIIFTLSAMPLAEKRADVTNQLAVIMAIATMFVLLIVLRLAAMHLYKVLSHLRMPLHHQKSASDPGIEATQEKLSGLSGRSDIRVMDAQNEKQLRELHEQLSQQLMETVQHLQQQSKSDVLEMVSTMNVYDKKLLGNFSRLIFVTQLQDGFNSSVPLYEQRIRPPPRTHPGAPPAPSPRTQPQPQESATPQPPAWHPS